MTQSSVLEISQCSVFSAERSGFPERLLECAAPVARVRLPFLQPPPNPLGELLEGTSAVSKSFLGNIRHYNSALQMSSFGATKEDVEPGFMPTFKV